MGVCHSSTNGTSATDSSSNEKPPSPLAQPLVVVPFTSIQNLASDSESERVLSTSLWEATSKRTTLILHQDRHALATLFSFIETKERILTIGRVCHLWLKYSVDPIAWAQDRYVLQLHPSKPYPDDISMRYRPLIRSVRLCGGVGGIKTAGSVEVSRMMNLTDLTGLTELTISDFGVPTNVVNEMAGLLYKAGMSLEPQADGSHQENSRRRSIQTLILTLSANQTHHLHPLFTSSLFRHLQQLHIRHLHVSQVESIGYLQELRELKLQEAHLSEVWNVIHQLPLLDTLAIDSCDPITTRPLPLSLTSLTLSVTESELVGHPVFSALSTSPPRHLQFLDLSITHKVATAVRPMRRLVQRTVVKVHTKPYPPGPLGIKSNPPIPDTVVSSVPHPRLVGVETNPGPQNSTTASSSHTPMDQLPSTANRNHHIRLHQDRAVLPLCLAFLECGEIVRSLGVCHYWKEATKNRQVWAHCTYQLRSGPLRLASMYHPFILRLHVHGPATHLLESNSLALFSRLTSFVLEQTVDEDDYWDKKLLPARYHTLFGLLPPTNEANTSASFTVAAPTITTTTATSTVSSLDTFKLTGWVHECALPLHIILPHPRFAHLNHLSIGEVYTTHEDVIAIRELKHLQTLSLFGDDPKEEWNGSSEFFEIFLQLPILNSLAIGYLPAFKNGNVVPLPPSITDLTVTDLLNDPLVSFTSKLIGLKSCRLGLSVMCRHRADDFGDWYDWMKWFAELTSLETFEVDITEDCGLAFIGLLPHLLTPILFENRSNLKLYQLNCDEDGIKQLVLKRSLPSSSTLPPASDHSIQPSRATFTIAPHSLDYHPLHFFDYLHAPLAHLVELELVGFTLSPLVVASLSHLPRSNHSRLQSFKLDADRGNFVLGHLDQPVKIGHEVLEKFFGIIGQQIHLRKLVLCGSWLHQFTSGMGESLAQLAELDELHLNTLINSECPPSCTAIFNQTIPQLPHLKSLHLAGACFLHTDNLRQLLQLLRPSHTLKELHCTILMDEPSNEDYVLMTQQQLSDLFATLPHLLTSIHQRRTHAKADADEGFYPDSSSTSKSNHSHSSDSDGED